jgi:hypothetical protein
VVVDDRDRKRHREVGTAGFIQIVIANL